ncbi:GL15008 [Drosophila persimilis]|uniref:GL15008 n=1 Tax=Drosophila persimilis TaxID=7234 RepID=B4H0L7_DROPE|nr:GL15008 [Drosophila persimilis]
MSYRGVLSTPSSSSLSNNQDTDSFDDPITGHPPESSAQPHLHRQKSTGGNALPTAISPAHGIRSPHRCVCK